MTVACFAQGLDLEALRRERHALLKSGLVGWAGWCQMTRWQRMDLLLRHQLELVERAKKLRGKGWQAMANAVVSRLLGFG